MPAAAWIRENRLSKNLYVIAPGSTLTEVELNDAMNRHDGLKDGWSGSKPVWFKHVERVGYWWYLIASALGSAFFVIASPTDDPVWLKALLGISAGPLILLIIQILVYGVAWLQVKLGGNTDKKALLREANKFVRPATYSYDRIGTILAMDPSIEPELHRLCWAAGGVGEAGRGAALDQLHELWRRADPAAAAEFDAKLRDLEEKVSRYRKDGKNGKA